MLPILQMNLKVPHRHVRPGRIQFPGTIVAADTREVHPFDGVGGLACLGCGTGELGDGVDGGVAHHAFEAVVGVLGFEGCEAGGEPFWGCGLGGAC